MSEAAEPDLAAGGGDGDSTRIKRPAIPVADLHPDQKQHLDAKQGVLVDATESGPASKAGIRRGDVILQFNNVEVGSVEQLKKLVADLPAGKAVPILVQRRGSRIFLALKREEDAKQ